MHGIIIGKFYPLHKGHCYLINYASSFCDELTIFLCSQKHELFEGEMRVNWLHKEYPNLTVHHITKEIPDAHAKNPQAPEIWAKELKSILSDKSVDLVFASETYGADLARLMNAKFMMLDGMRTVVPISGSEIRKNIYNHWDLLANSVKGDLSKLFSIEGQQEKIYSITKSVNSLYFDSLTLFVEDEIDKKLTKKIIYARLLACRKLGYPFVFCCVNNCKDTIKNTITGACDDSFCIKEDSDILSIVENIKSLLI